MKPKVRLLCLLPLFLLVTFVAKAQQPKVVRVGVVSAQYRQTPSVNSDVDLRRQRDQLVSYLNQPKFTNSRLKIEAVALTTTSGGGVLPDARSVKCDFVVYLQFFTHVAPQGAGTNVPASSFDAVQVSELSLQGFALQDVADARYIGGRTLGPNTPNAIKINVMAAMDEIAQAVIKAATP
jgi:hypothetical protein